MARVALWPLAAGKRAQLPRCRGCCFTRQPRRQQLLPLSSLAAVNRSNPGRIRDFMQTWHRSPSARGMYISLEGVDCHHRVCTALAQIHVYCRSLRKVTDFSFLRVRCCDRHAPAPHLRTCTPVQSSTGRKKKGGAGTAPAPAPSARAAPPPAARTAPPVSTQKWDEDGRCAKSGGRKSGRSKGRASEYSQAAFSTGAPAASRATPAASSTAAASTAPGDAAVMPHSDGGSRGSFSPPSAAVSIPGARSSGESAGARAGEAAGSAGRSAPQRSNRRPGGGPATSSYRSTAAAVASSDSAWTEGRLLDANTHASITR